MTCKTCEKKGQFDVIYALVDEIRKSCSEGLDKSYIEGIANSILILLEGK